MSRKSSKRPAPFSIRLSEGERKQLRKEAGDVPLGTHIRSKILGHDTTPAKVDYPMLARVLALLGKSELSTALCLLAIAAENGVLDVGDDTEADIRTACADIREVRLILIKALGLRP